MRNGRNVRYQAWSALPALLTFLCLIFLAVSISEPASAAAADWIPDLRFSWTAGGETVSVVPVKPATGKHPVLFLPGNCPADRLTVTLSDEEPLLLGDRPLHSGDVIDLSGRVGDVIPLRAADEKKATELEILRGSALPVVFFTIEPEDIPHLYQSRRNDLLHPASVTVLDSAGDLNCTDSLTSLHIRGNSTRTVSKKAFQFKLSRKADLADMGDGKTWILLANWFDVSLLRNQIVLDLCREIGLRGTPECRQTDVYINGAYNGTYLLTEKIQLKKNRLNITNMEDELEENNPEPKEGWKQKASNHAGVPILKYFDVKNEPEDLTGGYLLEIEKTLHYSENTRNAGFSTENWMHVLIKEPTHVGYEGARYIAGIVNSLHKGVLRRDGTDPKTWVYYADLIDLRSFARKVAVEEFSMNFDCRAASQFMFKDSDRVDSKIYAGPGWDYDLTFGNKDDVPHDPARTDFVYSRSTSESNLYHWLLTHEDFWRETRRALLEDLLPAARILTGENPVSRTGALRPLTEYREQIRASAEMNFVRWNTANIKNLYAPSGLNFDDAVTWLTEFIAARIPALEENWLTGTVPAK